MEQENPIIYYMVLDEKSTGPYSLDEITLHPRLTPETLVWKPGIETWVPAKSLPELTPAFAGSSPGSHYQAPPEFHSENQREYNSQNNYQNERSYQNSNHHNYHHPHYDYNRYQNNYRPGMRTNWLPWAIVATVLGFFTSCIGAIFGIIGIVQANKANTFYAQGFDREGDAANSNARIMTIIGLIFAGLGIIAVFWFSSLVNGIGNIYSL